MFKDYHDLVKLAEAEGFTVTSTTGGKHNVGSKHAKGLAIDIRTRDKTKAQCDAFIQKARSLGVVVRDERKRPPGQKVWSGAHIHLEIGRAPMPTVIKFGDKGEQVKEVQRFLFRHSLLKENEIDGHFGNRTLQAVKAFQYSKQIRVDGIVGETTLKLLKI